jgi:hypothetical protein
MKEKATTSKPVQHSAAPLLPTAATLSTEPSARPDRDRRNETGSGVIGKVSIQHRSSKEGSGLL